MKCQLGRVTYYYSLIMIGLVSLILLLLIIPLASGQSPTGDTQTNQFDQILKELNILTRQQLEPPSLPSLPELATTSTTTSRPSPHSEASSNSKNLDQFRLPEKYDPKRPPKRRPVIVWVNLTVLDAAIDRQENVVVLDMKLVESWNDRRLRLRKSKNSATDDDDDDNDDDGENGGRMQQAFVLGPEWLERLWHPVSRLRNNAHVTNALFDKPKKELEKTIEQANLVENIVVLSNSTTGTVWMALKMRVNIPVYECRRDHSGLYPFDKIQCSFHIANALYDRKMVVYQWDGKTKWDHNEYHSGPFYLQRLTTTVRNESIIDIDESGNEHSVMRIDFILQRQIGDYILNVYVLHIFLLVLCISTFWISINNIAVRLTLSIIILIIIKFQTFQAIRDEHRIVSALSIWTFGLSCLVIMAILCHILSYYSIQNEWNEKILEQLIETARKNRQRQQQQQQQRQNPLRSPTSPLSESNLDNGQFANNIIIINNDDNDHGNNNNNIHSTSAPTSNNGNGNNLPNAFYKANLNSSRASSPLSSSSSSRVNLAHQNHQTNNNTSKLKYFKRQCNKAYTNLLVWLNSIIVNNIADHHQSSSSSSSNTDMNGSSNLVDILSRIILSIIYILFIVIYFVKYAT